MTTLFVSLPSGLLVLREQGGSWTVAKQLEGIQAQRVALDPLRPERVYCGSWGRGLWRSADGGASWQPAGAGIPHADVITVAVSPNERSGDLGVVYAGTEPSALFRSEDGGESWRECEALRRLPSAPTWSFPPKPHTSHVRAIQPDPLVPGRLFVAVEAGALVWSPDGGETWHDRVPDGPYDSHTLAMHPAAPQRIYSAAGDGGGVPRRGYFESHDAGQSWQALGQGLERSYLWGLAVDSGDPDIVVVSGAYGPTQAHNPDRADAEIYRRTAGSTFAKVAGLPEPRGTLAYSLAAHPQQPGRYSAAANRGVFSSADGGETWQALPIPWPDAYLRQHVQGIAVAA